jgi:SAM-dependent methyltransferase
MRLFGNMSRRADLQNKVALLRMLRPFPEARVLEVGPGEENLAIRAGQLLGARQTVGLEYPGCAAAAAKPNFDVRECDLNDQRWPFDDRSFDVILTNQVIEHVPNTDHFVKEIARLLSDRGYAVISTPNLSSWTNIAMLTLGFQPNHNHVSDEFRGLGNPLSGQRLVKWEAATRLHLRLFTIKALADLMRVHGMKVEQVHGGSHPLPGLGRPLAWLDARHSTYANVRCSRA